MRNLVPRPTVIHHNNLQQSATICNNLQQSATICNNLQQSATICNNLQQSATICHLGVLQSLTLMYTTMILCCVGQPRQCGGPGRGWRLRRRGGEWCLWESRHPRHLRCSPVHMSYATMRYICAAYMYNHSRCM